ncbi:hypothetical protein TNCV_1667471 [Trichonephila clavipes]|nr:hypothetical protein TNCV_1667471 [Trichonephila clavipes]
MYIATAFSPHIIGDLVLRIVTRRAGDRRPERGKSQKTGRRDHVVSASHKKTRRAALSSVSSHGCVPLPLGVDALRGTAAARTGSHLPWSRKDEVENSGSALSSSGILVEMYVKPIRGFGLPAQVSSSSPAATQNYEVPHQ